MHIIDQVSTHDKQGNKFNFLSLFISTVLIITQLIQISTYHGITL